MKGQQNRANEPRINSDITADKVRLIDANGNMLGVCTNSEAQKKAESYGLDLVEIVPNSEPPVCKIMDYGKYRYEAQKKAHEAKKKQKVVSLKEVKLRPNIDPHDLGIKLNKAKTWLEHGDKVKFSLRFRGREMAHQDLGREVIARVQAELEEFAKIEVEPKMEGNQLVILLGPK